MIWSYIDIEITVIYVLKQMDGREIGENRNIFFKKSTEILELQVKHTEMKNSINEFNSRLEN